MDSSHSKLFNGAEELGYRDIITQEVRSELCINVLVTNEIERDKSNFSFGSLLVLS